MLKYGLAAAAASLLLATPAFAQDATANLGGLRAEGLLSYEGNDGKAIGYGVGLGYDVQSGGAVFGIEAEAMESNDKECLTDTAGRFCARAGRDLYVGGRLGAAIGSRSLIYAKAGYTNNRVEFEFDPAVGNTVTTKSDLNGVRVGGGLQFGLSPNMFVKGEYRYSNYEDGFDKHTGLVGLGFKF